MILTKTPLRISLAGGGTDFRDFYLKHPGHVVSTAIDKYVYVLVKELYDDLIILNYSKREEAERVDFIHHELIREALKKTQVYSAVEIHTLADIRSEGSGLGSSSSLTVGVLNALYMYQGIQVTAERLAQEACEIEIDICKKPIGKQDQYIAAYGGMCSFLFLDTEEVDVRKVTLDESTRRKLGNRLMLFYTGTGRKSEDILTEQRERIPTNIMLLDKLAALADDALWAVNTGDLDLIGTVLHDSWLYKKELASTISNPDIEKMVQDGLKAGALGGKICGAGGGGHLVLYVPLEKQEQVRDALSYLQEVPIALERDGSKVIFNARGDSIR